MLRLADLSYSDEELEQDAARYFKTAVYEPSYADKVKDFIRDDLIDFKNFYNDDSYVFCNLYADEIQNGYINEGDSVAPRTDFDKFINYLSHAFKNLDIDEDDLEDYAYGLDAEFRKNAFCTHMEPYFVGYDAVAATSLTGYAKNPLFSIYSMVREWAMAMHLKYMYPELMRKFGYRYQTIKTKFKGEERLRKLVAYRDKYRLTFQNISSLRAIHSSVFAYVYVFLKGVLSNEPKTAERFILDSSSSQIFLLLQGESIRNLDFPVTKYALEKLKNGAYNDLLFDDGNINWNALYGFVMDAIKNVGNTDKLRYIGFDSIEAKTIQSFWNKSANMQSMLKILRRMAMDNSDPIISRLIEMCEYRLGRPDKTKEKMERFIEQTRKLMVARIYEMLQPRMIDQTLVSAFPSVFLVYFQWHHNFRNVYPKVPKAKVNEQLQQQQRLKADDSLRNRIYAEDMQNIKFREVAREQNLRNEMQKDRSRLENINVEKQNKREDETLYMVIANKEHSRQEMLNRNNEQQKQKEDVSKNTFLERNQKQNSL